MRYLKTNTATRVTVGPFFDKTDGVTPETALTVTSDKLTLVVDDAGVPTLVLDVAPTASGGSNDMVHITGDDAGFYDLELAAANVNYVGRAMLALTDAATHCPVFHEFTILSAQVYDSLFGADVLQVHATEISNNLITAAAINADAITAAKLASDVATEMNSGLNNLAAGAAMTLTAGERTAIADAMRARQMTEGYAADGVAPTIEQSLFMIMQGLLQFAIVSTTITTKKLDKSTTAMTHTLDSDSAPTSRTRAT